LPPARAQRRTAPLLPTANHSLLRCLLLRLRLTVRPSPEREQPLTIGWLFLIILYT
jgi:hypothetical protein